jgi:hypothetical protein
VPLVKMAHLSADGASWLATCLMNPGKPITERSDLGQTFKILELLAGFTRRIYGPTSILAKITRSIRNCREQYCLPPQSLGNQNLVTTGRLMIDSRKRIQYCRLRFCQLVLCCSGGREVTACTGRSIIGWRVEWDIGILFQARAIKIRHCSELICARVNLVIHSLADKR